MQGIIHYSWRGWPLAGRASISKLKQRLGRVWGRDGVSGGRDSVSAVSYFFTRNREKFRQQIPTVGSYLEPLLPSLPTCGLSNTDHSKSVRVCHSQRLPTSFRANVEFLTLDKGHA